MTPEFVDLDRLKEWRAVYHYLVDRLTAARLRVNILERRQALERELQEARLIERAAELAFVEHMRKDPLKS